MRCKLTLYYCCCVQEKSLGDSGADESVMPMRVLHALRQKGINPNVHRFETPVKLQQSIKSGENGSGESFTASMKVRIGSLQIKLPCGTLRLRNVDFWVTDQDMDEVLLGRPLLRCIGFDLDQHLASVRQKFDNIDVDEKIAKELNTRLPLHKDKTKRICSIKSYRGLWYDQTEGDPVDPVPAAGANMGVDSESDISAVIESIIRAAKEEGMSAEGLATAEALLNEFRDIFRTKLGSDPPAKLKPLKIRMQPTAKPFRSTQRRYAPKQREFLVETIKKLTEVGATYPNPSARWASPALAVPKAGGEGFRFTVDLRGPNRETIPVASAMPNMKGQIGSTAGSKAFAKLDICHAYWQVPLDGELQECMSIQTPLGVYTPTRILQG